MSSRLKERGGGGGKIMASKPQKTLTEGTPKEKGIIRRTPIAGKENSRTLSSGKVTAFRQNSAVKQIEKPVLLTAAVRWSTSSIPRGKASKPSDFSRLLSDLHGDSLPRVSSSNRMGKTLGRDLEAEAGERKSFGGSSVKGHLGLKSKGSDEQPMNVFRVSETRKPNGYLGLQLVKNGSRVSEMTLGKHGEKSVNGVLGLENCRRKVDSVSSLKSLCLNGTSGTEEDYPVALKARKDKENGNTILEICKDRADLVSNPNVIDGNTLDVVRSSEKFNERERLLDSKMISEIVLDGDEVLVNHKERDCSVSYLKDTCEKSVSGVIRVVDSSKGDVAHAGLDYKEEAGEQGKESTRVLESLNKPRFDEEGKSIQKINKYPSKLHEKLAQLEGKVQKIASDIKRTKEMLDLNNPDASKLVLSDIQNKISGIEKAVVHVMDGTKCELGSSEPLKDDSLHPKHMVTSRPGQVGDSKNSAKGLNHEELEARFYPHHKLLRSRTSLDASGGQKQNYKANLLKHGDSEKEDGSLSPIEENPIALEFLASLNTDQPKINKHDRIVPLELSSIREMGSEGTGYSAGQCASKKLPGGGQNEDIVLMTNEKLEDFDNQENKPAMMLHEETEESCMDQLFELGRKPSTGGWFVSEGEGVLLAHDDGSCSYYDIANTEEKAEYKPPAGISDNLWRDCWLIRAPGADGCSGRYIVAASAGNTLDSGFCSWDFYTKDIRAFRVEDETPNSFSSTSSRAVLAPLTNTSLYRRSASSTMRASESKQWWYKPCGPLLISTASGHNIVSAHDIRDGDLVMRWEVHSPVLGMEYSSPLQWRSRGKVLIAETEAISLWDVNSLNPQPLLSVSTVGKKVYALHVNNTDAELGGGVRQRVSSSEVEGNDGVFCTPESINVFDFRVPSGVGLKISRQRANAHSIFSRGDSIFIGGTETRLPMSGPSSRVQHFSLRKGKLVTTYSLPDSSSHIHHSSITQVWGNTNLVMGICGMGLFVFDALKDGGMQFSSIDHGKTAEVKETIGPDDLYCPTFDYLGSRVLVISRDRPAMWRYLL